MGSTIYSAPRSAWALLIVALFAVSSAGAVLQSMTEVPPILRASWRMQGTALILLPGFIYQIYHTDSKIFELQDIIIIFVSSIFLAAHFELVFPKAAAILPRVGVGFKKAQSEDCRCY